MLRPRAPGARVVATAPAMPKPPPPIPKSKEEIIADELFDICEQAGLSRNEFYNVIKALDEMGRDNVVLKRRKDD